MSQLFELVCLRSKKSACSFFLRTLPRQCKTCNFPPPYTTYKQFTTKARLESVNSSTPLLAPEWKTSPKFKSSFTSQDFPLSLLRDIARKEKIDESDYFLRKESLKDQTFKKSFLTIIAKDGKILEKLAGIRKYIHCHTDIFACSNVKGGKLIEISSENRTPFSLFAREPLRSDIHAIAGKNRCSVWFIADNAKCGIFGETQRDREACKLELSSHARKVMKEEGIYLRMSAAKKTFLFRRNESISDDIVSTFDSEYGSSNYLINARRPGFTWVWSRDPSIRQNIAKTLEECEKVKDFSSRERGISQN